MDCSTSAQLFLYGKTRKIRQHIQLWYSFTYTDLLYICIYTVYFISHATRYPSSGELRADGGGPEFGPMLVSLASVLALLFIHTYTKVLYG